MASARREKGKKTWVLVWDEPRDPETGKRRQRTKRGFPTKAAALAWHRRYEDQKARHSGEATTGETVADYLARWLSDHKARDGTLYSYERTHRVNINPYLGKVPLAELGPRHIREWHQQLLDGGLVPITIRGIHIVLSMALNSAVRNGIIERNPCRQVRPPRVEKRTVSVWNAEQIQAFLALADEDKLGLLYRLMLFSQVRPGEALTMQWDDIDWHKGTVTVSRTRTRNRDGRHVVGREPKTRSSSRTIPLSEDLMERLRRHRSAQNDIRELVAEGWHDLNLVFSRGDGRMLSDGQLSYRLTRLARLAGIPRLTPHELRHSGATLLLEMGEELTVISKRLGHRSIATTADIYLTVSDRMQRDVSDRLDAVLRPVTPVDDRVIGDRWAGSDSE